jgi:hypothetical protein
VITARLKGNAQPWKPAPSFIFDNADRSNSVGLRRAWLSLLVALSSCVAGGYREAHLSQPAEVLTRGFSIEVSRVYLNEETVTDGIADGSALVVHAAADDFKTDPTGNSGGRIACGVLVKAPSPR